MENKFSDDLKVLKYAGAAGHMFAGTRDRKRDGGEFGPRMVFCEANSVEEVLSSSSPYYDNVRVFEKTDAGWVPLDFL